MDPIIGNITNPVPNLGEFDSGLILLLNNLLRIVFIAAGVYTFILILIAGLEYIDAGGNAEKLGNARNKIWTALIGLLVMVISFIIAIGVGQLFFNDPTAIINPKIPVAQ